jgi:hypothetical protein
MVEIETISNTKNSEKLARKVDLEFSFRKAFRYLMKIG